jgi:hypothetical protein
MFLSHNLLYLIDSTDNSVQVYERNTDEFIQLFKIDAEYVKDWY